MDASMVDRYDDDEASPCLFQRRWSAATSAAKTLKSECDVLREVMELAEQAWRSARLRLATVQSLRDELAAQLTDPDVSRERESPLFDRADELAA